MIDACLASHSELPPFLDPQSPAQDSRPGHKQQYGTWEGSIGVSRHRRDSPTMNCLQPLFGRILDDPHLQVATQGSLMDSVGLVGVSKAIRCASTVTPRSGALVLSSCRKCRGYGQIAAVAVSGGDSKRPHKVIRPGKVCAPWLSCRLPLRAAPPPLLLRLSPRQPEGCPYRLRRRCTLRGAKSRGGRRKM